MASEVEMATSNADASIASAAPAQPALNGADVRKQRLAAFGGVLGALAASACCIVPLVLFGLGVSGAWIGNLTALSPYQPVFMAVTVGFLGYGFYLVYWRSRRACADGEECARPLSGRIVMLGLWTATILVAAAFAFNFVAPLLLAA